VHLLATDVISRTALGLANHVVEALNFGARCTQIGLAPHHFLVLEPRGCIVS
jgi:hypothetical protein